MGLSFIVELVTDSVMFHAVGVPTWVLQGNSGATSKKQHYNLCVGTTAVTV